VQAFTHEMIAEDLVHNVASDAHNATRRPPGLGAAIEEGDHALPGLAERAEWMCHDVPRAILDGGPIPGAPVPPPQRRRRGLFRASRRR
jgi:tyrosine-protein phosphatase YwqE